VKPPTSEPITAEKALIHAESIRVKSQSRATTTASRTSRRSVRVIK
jgi:hypothetical protein